jgi:predicted HicB family RNase H-like nuclease
MNMQLEGYVARIEYDEDEKTFRCKVANIRSLNHWAAETLARAAAG